MCNSGNAVLPAIRMRQPTEGDGYMIVARELLPGVEVLSILPNLPSRAAALIAAQALECVLKAFLWHKGKKTDIRAPEVQHNLVALWKMAYDQDLSIPQEPPDWCTILSSGHGQNSEHGQNFYFRYQEGVRNPPGDQTNIVHGGETPALIPMAVEIRKLIEMVELAVKR